MRIRFYAYTCRYDLYHTSTNYVFGAMFTVDVTQRSDAGNDDFQGVATRTTWEEGTAQSNRLNPKHTDQNDVFGCVLQVMLRILAGALHFFFLHNFVKYGS